MPAISQPSHQTQPPTIPNKLCKTLEYDVSVAGPFGAHHVHGEPAFTDHVLRVLSIENSRQCKSSTHIFILTNLEECKPPPPTVFYIPRERAWGTPANVLFFISILARFCPKGNHPPVFGVWVYVPKGHPKIGNSLVSLCADPRLRFQNTPIQGGRQL